MHYYYLNLNYCLCLYSRVTFCLCLYGFFLACQFLVLYLHSTAHFLHHRWLVSLYGNLHLFLLPLSVPIVLQIIVRMFSISISGMPNNGCPFLGTIKKLYTLSLCSIFHSTYAYLCYCWSVVHFGLMFVYLVATNCSIVALGNNFCKCITVVYFHHYLVNVSLLVTRCLKERRR